MLLDGRRLVGRRDVHDQLHGIFKHLRDSGHLSSYVSGVLSFELLMLGSQGGATTGLPGGVPAEAGSSGSEDVQMGVGQVGRIEGIQLGLQLLVERLEVVGHRHLHRAIPQRQGGVPRLSP